MQESDLQQNSGPAPEPIRIYVIGGFLGSGKTTALCALARHFAAKDKRCALITNDQTGGLVDTAVIQTQGIAVREIVGGCICARFHDFLKAADTLFQEYRPDVIVAEPVGTCSELIPTVVEPLKKHTGERYTVMPLTVLVDPVRQLAMDGDSEIQNRETWPDDIRHLYESQFLEADLLVFTKRDAYDDKTFNLSEERVRMCYYRKTGREPRTHQISAKTGQGIEDWLAALDDLAESPHAGSPISMEKDRPRFARAESQLGWINIKASCNTNVRVGTGTCDLAALAQGILHRVDDLLGDRLIAHLKIFAEDDRISLRAGLTHSGGSVTLEPIERGDGRMLSSPVEGLRLIVNLRATGEPKEMAECIHRALVEVAAIQRIELEIERKDVLIPERPQPMVQIGGLGIT